jgi:hypothetical protein
MTGLVVATQNIKKWSWMKAELAAAKFVLKYAPRSLELKKNKLNEVPRMKAGSKRPTPQGWSFIFPAFCEYANWLA